VRDFSLFFLFFVSVDDVPVRVPAALCVSAIPGTKATYDKGKRLALVLPVRFSKINLINWCVRLEHISEIKLIRTDTTLDQGQIAEKVYEAECWMHSV